MITDIMLEVRWSSPARHHRLYRFEDDYATRNWWFHVCVGIRRHPENRWINPAAYVNVLGLLIGVGILFEERTSENLPNRQSSQP